MGQNHKGGGGPTEHREKELQVEGGCPSHQRSRGPQAHLTVVTLHVVVSVHGHHTDGGLTALEDEMGFARNQHTGV